jgi:hypothetical protein
VSERVGEYQVSIELETMLVAEHVVVTWFLGGEEANESTAITPA